MAIPGDQKTGFGTECECDQVVVIRIVRDHAGRVLGIVN